MNANKGSSLFWILVSIFVIVGAVRLNLDTVYARVQTSNESKESCLVRPIPAFKAEL